MGKGLFSGILLSGKVDLAPYVLILETFEDEGYILLGK